MLETLKAVAKTRLTGRFRLPLLLFLRRFLRGVGRALSYGHAALPLVNAHLFQYLLEGGTHVLEPPLEQSVNRIPLLQALQDTLESAQGVP